MLPIISISKAGRRIGRISNYFVRSEKNKTRTGGLLCLQKVCPIVVFLMSYGQAYGCRVGFYASD